MFTFSLWVFFFAMYVPRFQYFIIYRNFGVNECVPRITATKSYLKLFLRGGWSFPWLINWAEQHVKEFSGDSKWYTCLRHGITCTCSSSECSYRENIIIFMFIHFTISYKCSWSFLFFGDHCILSVKGYKAG